VSRCPSCGSPLDLPVEAVGGVPAEGDEVELGRPRARWWPAAAVMAALGLVGLAAVVAGGQAPRAADSTTTTLPSTTPVATAPPATTTPAASTTATTLVARRTLPGAPFLQGTVSRGTVLYGLDLDLGQLWRVDLDTGETVVRSTAGALDVLVASPYGSSVQLLATRGGAVFGAVGAPVVHLPDDPDAEARVLAMGSVWPLAHADPSLVWIVTLGPRVTARVVDLTGAVVAGPVAVPFGHPLGDDGTGRLLLKAGEATYALDAGGGAERVANDPLVAWDAARTVTVECAEAELRCELVSRARPGGEELGRVAAPVSLIESDLAGARLAPGGQALASLGFGPSGIRLELDHLDGRPGRAYSYLAGAWGGPVGANEPPLWWVGDALLCGLEEPGTVRCWSDGPQQATYQLEPAGLPPLAAALIVTP
jgi:hypothetical protein